MFVDPLDGDGRGEDGRKRGEGNTHWVECPIEMRLNMLEKLKGQITKPVKLHHLRIQDIQGRNHMGLANASGLLRNEVPAGCQLS